MPKSRSFTTISVEFEISAQNWRAGQFSIPKPITDLLNLRPNDKAMIEVTSRNGTKGFLTALKSGREIYRLLGHVEASEFIRVRVTPSPRLIQQ
jgi:bifunctional DNA-binding transcriptional regulator/antitoxin component of YhaV-PrlF toxin-antitoxin module